MIRSLVHFLIDPSVYVVLGFLLLWAYAWQKSGSRMRKVLWLVLFVPVVILGLPVVEPLIESRERQFPVLEVENLDTSAPYVILVLGAGKTSDPALLPSQQLNATMAMRLIEGYRLYRQLPKARLALSGSYFGSAEAQAEVTARAALALGVDPKDTMQLREGIHTESEISQIARRLPSGEQLIVVSSALHLPRVSYWLQAHGLKAALAPTDFILKEDPTSKKGSWQNSPARRLQLWQQWWHETLGLLHARWRT